MTTTTDMQGQAAANVHNAIARTSEKGHKASTGVQEKGGKMPLTEGAAA